MLKWEGPFLSRGSLVKPSLTPNEQVELLRNRGLGIPDEAGCAEFLSAHNYYRFSGYARYFQNAPHDGDDSFRAGVSFSEISAIYDADQALRATLSAHLVRAELVLRTHFARVIADSYTPYSRYLEESFYIDVGEGERTAESCLRDIERSRERHILRFAAVATASGNPDYSKLPVWSAVEAWSFGTLSKCIERGGQGTLAPAVAASMGVAQAGFAYRVRSLVYLRNRCAHHSRLWHHSMIDAGPTPRNVRQRAKRIAGQFEPRAVLDAVASLDDIVLRATGAEPVLPGLVNRYRGHQIFWAGLASPVSPRDHIA